MRINSLELQNIGPFINAKIDFIGLNKKPPITIITGENGTGKTIIIDAIRAQFLGYQGSIQRNIVRENDNFSIKSNIEFNKKIHNLATKEFGTSNVDKKVAFQVTDNGASYPDLANIFTFEKNAKGNIWIVNYWTSKSDNKNYKLTNLEFLEPEKYLLGSLNGIQSNVEVIKLITYFDYLKSSDNPNEKKEGEFLFETLKSIIKLSLIDGEFKYVERKTLMPVVSQNGFEVSLDKLSSGNLYLIQRLISLLGQMYSVYVLNNLKLDEMLQTPGVLMIDEAENHLHPKWQKSFLNSILSIFPNLQIIVTTHSPFIVSSIENARVYVCKSMKDYSVLIDETDLYSNKPIDEVLASDVFETSPFSESITKLLRERQESINQNNFERSEQIETELKAINPQYFSYFDIDKLLKSVSNK